MKFFDKTLGQRGSLLVIIDDIFWCMWRTEREHGYSNPRI